MLAALYERSRFLGQFRSVSDCSSCPLTRGSGGQRAVRRAGSPAAARIAGSAQLVATATDFL